MLNLYENNSIRCTKFKWLRNNETYEITGTSVHRNKGSFIIHTEHTLVRQSDKKRFKVDENKLKKWFTDVQPIE